MMEETEMSSLSISHSSFTQDKMTPYQNACIKFEYIRKRLEGLPIDVALAYIDEDIAKRISVKEGEIAVKQRIVDMYLSRGLDPKHINVDEDPHVMMLSILQDMLRNERHRLSIKQLCRQVETVNV